MAANQLAALIAAAGRWRGDNRLQQHGESPEDSPATATVTGLLGERFVRFDYTWASKGQPQEGSLLIGHEAAAGVATAEWIDSWHMNDVVMHCRGQITAAGGIDVRGGYAAPPGPDWGWRIVVEPEGAERLVMTMFNISPAGDEELAVRAKFTRSGTT